MRIPGKGKIWKEKTRFAKDECRTGQEGELQCTAAVQDWNFLNSNTCSEAKSVVLLASWHSPGLPSFRPRLTRYYCWCSYMQQYIYINFGPSAVSAGQHPSN